MQYQECFSLARAPSRVGTIGLALLLALWPAAAALAGGGAPDTQFTQVEPDPTNDTTGDFAFTSTIPNSTFECSIDAATFISCPTPYHTPVQADGTHVLQVRAREPGGIADPTPAEHTWRVDTVRPDTTITGGPSGGVTSDTAVFTFESSEVGGSFLCIRDGGTQFGCSSPITFTNLAQGSHTFTVRAIDAAGNSDLTPASRTWSIDSIAPDTTITEGPNGSVTETTATFRFSSNEATATFECSFDAAAFAACTTPKTFNGVSEGPHTFEVRAVDVAGNADPTPAVGAWTVDNTAPETTITSAPGTFSNSTTAVITFSSNEANVTFECTMDGTTTACTSPTTYNNLLPGQHILGVRARDAAGNPDPSPDIRTWLVDLVAPDTNITSGPSGTITATDATFTFSATEPGSTFQCALASGTFSACTSPKSYTTLADGTHTFEVRATDPAGNQDGTPAARGWTVDTTAPDSSFTQTPPDPSATSTATFAFRANEPGSTFRCSLDVAPFAACTSPVTTPVLGNGAHSFEVEATDAVGNVETTPATFTWTIVTDEVFSHGFED